MIRTYDGMEPQIAESAYVDDAAVVTGDVVIEAEASVWPNVSLRGDHGRIVVGTGANVQDNAVLHEDAILGPNTTVGHGAIVHAATVEEGALVGINAVVLDDAHIGENAVVGAGAVVTEGTAVEPATLVTGIPARPKAHLDDPPSSEPAEQYKTLATRHENTSHYVDPR